MTRAYFLVAAADQPGLVARLAGFFYELGLNIVDASNHTDTFADAGPRFFFMRLVVDLGGLGSPKAQGLLGGSATRATLESHFSALCRALDASFTVSYSDVKPRVAILVTKEPACLYDLILRQQNGELPCDIPLVISNHAALESVAAGFRIPFFALPVITPGSVESKRAQEESVLALLKAHQIDLPQGGARCRATCRSCPTVFWRRRRRSSTFTTAFCRRSRAPSRTTRRMRAASR